MPVRAFLEKIHRTQAPWTINLLRIALGYIFVKEGAGKIYGWFGGGGIESVAAYFQGLGIIFPRFNAYLVGYTEFLGGLLLILGLLARPVAFFIGCIMVVAILTAHRQGGYHYPMLILFICIAFLQSGAGRVSIDWLMSGRKGGV
ncbi:MAG: DoxX family protein [Candidatus Omnitrophota bacterium]